MDHLRPYLGSTLDVLLAKRLANQLNTASDDSMPFQSLFDTFAQYEGKGLDIDSAAILSMQIAGREDELKDGALKLYSHPVKEEWVPLEIIAVTPAPWREGEAGQEIELLALGGHPAGHTLRKVVPEPWLNYLAYQVGFSRRRRYPEEPWMFTGLRLWGYLVPDEDNTQLQFENWGVSDKLKSQNSKIVAYRVRFYNKSGEEDPYCPMEYEHDCCECHIRSDQCPGAIIRTR